jgi:hypothetical protein
MSSAMACSTTLDTLHSNTVSQLFRGFTVELPIVCTDARSGQVLQYRSLN